MATTAQLQEVDTSVSHQPERRPAAVTIVGVLVVAAGALNLAEGVVGILDRGDASRLAEAITDLALGLLALAIARGRPVEDVPDELAAIEREADRLRLLGPGWDVRHLVAERHRRADRDLEARHVASLRPGRLAAEHRLLPRTLPPPISRCLT